MGNVWLTVMGITVGNRVSSGVEHIGIAISALSDLGSRTGTRANSQLQNLDPRSALNMVMSAVYDDYYLGVDDDRDDVAGHEVLPYITGQAFDGWEAMIVEVGGSERFIWRHEGEDSVESKELPIGSLQAAAEEAHGWLSMLVRTNER